jgi:AmiR/NasT family two-component response regulator
VIAILHAADPDYVRQAARRGVFAYIIESTPEELQAAIEITLHRFGEFRRLQGAFGRRALIEQAKGILMAQHGISEDEAFSRLREESQTSGHKLSEIALALTESHRLLRAPSASSTE